MGLVPVVETTVLLARPVPSAPSLCECWWLVAHDFPPSGDLLCSPPVQRCLGSYAHPGQPVPVANTYRSPLVSCRASFWHHRHPRTPHGARQKLDLNQHLIFAWLHLLCCQPPSTLPAFLWSALTINLLHDGPHPGLRVGTRVRQA